MGPKDSIGRCPICGEVMHITRLECDSCNTVIESKFDICRFCQLPKEQKAFLEVFIKNRGSIKDVERELGISYPTVRAKLDAVIASMGFDEAEGKEEMSAPAPAKKRGRTPSK